jgi:hypothetical protein
LCFAAVHDQVHRDLPEHDGAAQHDYRVCAELEHEVDVPELPT